MERPRWFHRTVALTRLIIMVPVISTFAGSVTLVGIGAYRTVLTMIQVVSGTVDEKAALVKFITLADLFLLSTVLYVVAIGLYELFVDDNLPLPEWLQVHSLEDLKEKLIGVVVVALAVFFLGQVVSGIEAVNAAALGIGTAAAVASLAYFTKGLKHPETKHDE